MGTSGRARKTEQVNYRFDPETRRKVKRLSVLYGGNQSTVVRRAIVYLWELEGQRAIEAAARVAIEAAGAPEAV